MKKIVIILSMILCILTAQFFNIGLDLQTVYAADLTGTDSSSSPTIYNFITDLKITQTGSDNSLPPDLGSNVPKDAGFRMTYYFEIPEYSNYHDDDHFYLILPDYVDVPAEVVGVAINDTNYGTHVLDVSMLIGAGPLGEDVILVDFAAEQYISNNNPDPNQVRAYSGQFWFEASFDAAEVGTGGPITIEFDSGRVAAPYNVLVDFEADPGLISSIKFWPTLVGGSLDADVTIKIATTLATTYIQATGTSGSTGTSINSLYGLSTEDIFTYSSGSPRVVAPADMVLTTGIGRYTKFILLQLEASASADLGRVPATGITLRLNHSVVESPA